jgi:predicted hotdog family 3-hydroxylacyl-ACP dehydratase
MCLIDRIVKVDPTEALTEAHPREHWPLRQGDAVSSLLAVELGAQTAGVLIGFKERQGKEGEDTGRGWLVGIRRTLFHESEMPLGACVETRARLGFNYATYVEIEAITRCGGRPVADMTLQLFWNPGNAPPLTI